MKRSVGRRLSCENSSQGLNSHHTSKGHITTAASTSQPTRGIQAGSRRRGSVMGRASGWDIVGG